MEKVKASWHPFDAFLDDKEKERVLQTESLLNLEKGQLIYSGDSKCLGFIKVVTGCLRAYLLSEEGKEMTLYTLKEGEFCILSSSCVLSQMVFEVHIEADERSQVHVIPSEIMKALSKNHIEIENFVLKEATHRFSEVLQVLQSLLFVSLDKRLAKLIWDMYSETGSCHLKITQEEMAKKLGSAREVISRTLKIFSEKKVLVSKRGSLEIIDLKTLKQWAYEMREE